MKKNSSSDNISKLLISYDGIIEKKVNFGKFQIIFILVQCKYNLKLIHLTTLKFLRYIYVFFIKSRIDCQYFE